MFLRLPVFLARGDIKTPAGIFLSSAQRAILPAHPIAAMQGKQDVSALTLGDCRKVTPAPGRNIGKQSKQAVLTCQTQVCYIRP
ncbi:MAG: hypothetical protein JXB88_07315 [Spirochaetales bacterium]|nr:hypothetical protein [Spirochaetales bacterium]